MAAIESKLGSRIEIESESESEGESESESENKSEQVKQDFTVPISPRIRGRRGNESPRLPLQSPRFSARRNAPIFAEKKTRFTSVEVQEPEVKLPAYTNNARSAFFRKKAAEASFSSAKISTEEEKTTNPLRSTEQDVEAGYSLFRGSALTGVPSSFTSEFRETTIRELQVVNDVGFYGRLWRKAVKKLILLTKDEVNSLRITRGLQFSIPFQNPYESYLLEELVVAFQSNDKTELLTMLNIIFQNRNVTRLFMRNMPRWDIFFHQDQQLKSAIFYDVIGITIGLIGFPPSENFVNTRNFTISSAFRILLGQGHFITRFLTGRQALITDDPEVIAQNLAAEGAGFEGANRVQWGTYLGRIKTNQFRAEHRLPTDESIVRSFIMLPLPTCVNNGIEHVLRQLINHWRNMLYQPFGNFAHQRMEQLNPFEMLRFHIPVILVVLSQLRGLSRWDKTVLGPFISRLQLINSQTDVSMSPIEKEIHKIIEDMKENIVVAVCGGIASRIDLLNWFLDTIYAAVDVMKKEAEKVKSLIDNDKVTTGWQLAQKIMDTTTWEIPNDSTLDSTIFEVCTEKTVSEKRISVFAVKRAINLLATKDKRTLIQLCKPNDRTFSAHAQGQSFHQTKPASLLFQRTRTLIQRELFRDALDANIRKLSKGSVVEEVNLILHRLYWVINTGIDEYGVFREAVYSFEGANSNSTLIFQNFFTQTVRIVKLSEVMIYEYIEIAEEIVRAQKAFMTLELEHGKKFSYNAFMEYAELRSKMLRLMSVSQIQCEALDDARLNILQSLQINANHQLEISLKDCNPGETCFVYKDGQYQPFSLSGSNDDNKIISNLKDHKIVKVPPQSMLVVGSGPTGLLATIHCLENVLLSGGTMRLYESRDAYQQAGATFERSQVVRLDARWIAMLRFHLGTIYEDIFVPAAGETDSHYGNSLPFQGFIEITIKDLENMINIQVAKALSRGLLKHDTNSNVQYDFQKNRLVKKAAALKEGDLILRKVNEKGHETSKDCTWKVVKLLPPKTIPTKQLTLEEQYVIYRPAQKAAFKFLLKARDVDSGTYTFRSLDPSHDETFVAHIRKMPQIYSASTNLKAPCEFFVMESVHPIEDTASPVRFIRQNIPFNDHEHDEFLMDSGQSHIVTATGKPHRSDHHINFTTEEPYGVCCLSGLKVSMGMHNFGTRRWKNGLLDDIRSQSDQNTRVIGDFTKIVNSKLIAMKMVEVFEESMDWKMHFENLASENGYAVELAPNISSLLLEQVKYYYRLAPYQRHHLQTRFFETGDNFYLGMEFTREYDRWKMKAIASVVEPITQEMSKKFARTEIDKNRDETSLKNLKNQLNHHIDRLWFFAALEVIRIGDVYNPGGRSKVPHLYLIDHYIPTAVSKLDIGETFIPLDERGARYEILLKKGSVIVARNHEGYLKAFPSDMMVKLGGNLTRGPDGLLESKVAMSTFPVGHYVNYRSMKLANSLKGYAFAFLGDEQSSPHFMRYSGLTGAAINIMTFNNFIGDAIEGMQFIDRFYLFAAVTNWSNGEVVQRGTTSNFGVDGFLRPGFPYKEGIKYLHAKVIEHLESGQYMESGILSRDWKIKFAAALIPRGLEYHNKFRDTMLLMMQEISFDYFVENVEADASIKVSGIKTLLNDARERCACLDSATGETFWKMFIEEMEKSLSSESLTILQEKHCQVALYLEETIDQIVVYARTSRDANARISTVADTQPKSVDSFIDLLAPEAQVFASNLAQSSTFAAMTLGLRIVTLDTAVLASIASAWYSMGTATNGSRYKNRHEEWRNYFYEQRYDHILKRVFSCLHKADRGSIDKNRNPFYILLEAKKTHFVEQVYYYDYAQPVEFLKDYKNFIENIHDQFQIQNFSDLLETKYIADIYHVNSYLQEKLVDILLIVEEMLHVANNYDDNQLSGDCAIEFRNLFERLVLFKPRLATSLQQGNISLGAFRQTQWKHGYFAGVLQFFIFKIYISVYGYHRVPQTLEETIQAAGGSWKPVILETKEILHQMKFLQEKLPQASLSTSRTSLSTTTYTVAQKYSLHREIVDMRSLYAATHESYLASCLVVSGILNFCTGTIFFVSNAALLANKNQKWAQDMSIAAAYSFGLISPLTAILAVYFFRKHFVLLRKCVAEVNKKLNYMSIDANRNNNRNNTGRNNSSNIKNSRDSGNSLSRPEDEENKKENLIIIRHVARVKAIAIFFRVLASFLVAVALPWALADYIGKTEEASAPLYMAIVSASLQIFTAIALYFIEYTVIFNSTPLMGELCCSSFEQEILQLEASFIQPRNSVQTRQFQDREVWEYVAKAFLHKYRFDTIYAINRFGSIMQYIHSGCVPSKETMTMNFETVQVTVPEDISVQTAMDPPKMPFPRKLSRTNKSGNSAETSPPSYAARVKPVMTAKDGEESKEDHK